MSGLNVYIITYEGTVQAVAASIPLAQTMLKKFIEEKEFELGELKIEQWPINLYGTPFKVIKPNFI